jgi:hypothetical protein
MTNLNETTDWYQEGTDQETIRHIPVRVRAGKAEKDQLTLQTYNGDEVIKWEDIELMCLGVIRCVKNEKIPESQIRKMVKGIFFGEESSHEPEEYTVSQLLDIYVRDQQAPYRIDKDNINYKSFLVSPSYVSALNFEPLVKRLVFFARSTRINSSLSAFLIGDKDKIFKYKSIYEFQEDSEKNRKDLESLKSRADVEIFP